MYLDEMIEQVSETHPKFGELIAICQLVIKARKFALIVSPSGFGKSTAMKYTADTVKDNWQPSALTIASLGTKADWLNGYRSVIVVDDIATIQTMYSRIASITTLSQLCYMHRVSPSVVGFDFTIEDFFGSGLVGIQPIVLRDLLLDPVWDGSVQDKSLRYYHLQRPIKPYIGMPPIPLCWGIDIDKVNQFTPDIENEAWQNLETLGSTQWSPARTLEHLTDLCRACAALDGRTEVEENDIELLTDLLRPMALESIAISKEDFEGDKILNNNLLIVLAEYYTYGEVSLGQLAVDYRLSASQTYRIMERQSEFWEQISKSPTIYRPSKALTAQLRRYGLEYKGD